MEAPQQNSSTDNQSNEDHTKAAPTANDNVVAGENAQLKKNDQQQKLNQEIDDVVGDADMMKLLGLEGQPEKAPKDKKAPRKHKGGKKSHAVTPQVRTCVGKVLNVSGEDIFIDLGGKSQGVLSGADIPEGKIFTEGEEIEVVIAGFDPKDSLVILTTKDSNRIVQTDTFEVGQRVEAFVTGVNKGGIEVRVSNQRGFMPASQIDVGRVENLEEYLGQKIICEVTRIEPKNVVVSRRSLMDRENAQKADELWKTIESGQKHKGTVRSMMDYGVFVDIGGVDGLLHVAEMSWARVNKPSDVLAIGQEIEVVVVKLDIEKKRISLSLKQGAANPWLTVADKYQVGMKLDVKVVSLMNFGAFAELEPGVEGLIPVSEMSWAGRVNHPKDVVDLGAIVEVELITVNSEKQKISMSLKRMSENPWSNIKDKYKPDEILKGKVVRIAPFGAFIELEKGVDGLIHISELSTKHVAQVSDVVKEGQEVEVKILEVNEEDQKISLSIKALTATATGEGSSATQASITPKTPVKRPARGGLNIGGASLSFGDLKM